MFSISFGEMLIIILVGILVFDLNNLIRYLKYIRDIQDKITKLIFETEKKITECSIEEIINSTKKNNKNELVIKYDDEDNKCIIKKSSKKQNKS